MENDNRNRRKANFFANNGSLKDGKDAFKLEFEPHLEEMKQQKYIRQDKKVSYFELFQYATGSDKVLLYTGIVFGVLCGGFLPLIIVIYGEFTTLLVDRNTPNKTISPTLVLRLLKGGRHSDGTPEDRVLAIKEDANAFGIELGVLAVFQFFVSFTTVMTLNYSALMQTSRLRRDFLKAVLRQDMAWFDCNNANSFPSKMIEDLNKVQEGIGEKVGIFINLVTGFVASVTMAFFYGWKLTLVMLSCAPILIASNALVSKIQTSLTTREMETYGRAGSVAEEVFSSIKTVMAFNGQEKEIKRYEKQLQRSEKTGIRRGLLSGLGSGTLWGITYSCYALAFWYGVSLILESRAANTFEYTPAVLIIIFFGVLAGAITLGQSSPHLEAFSVARGAAASVFSILRRQPKIDPLSKKGLVLSNFKGDIHFKGIHFQYPARPEVQILKGLNLQIKSGEHVALVGASGCGKSTVVQLLQRFYDPSQGSVSLDGVDLTDINVSWLRKQLGVVEQEPSLFATTIYENIKCGQGSATKEDVEEAAKLANAHDFIVKLPNGYQTVLGAKGSQISGGQKQRIAIARALIRNPKILLLDEATSALDAASEMKVQQALEHAAKGRTTLVVTHKFSTISKVDRIVVLSEGRVVEEGSHDELIRLKGHYFKLLEMQNNDEKSIIDCLCLKQTQIAGLEVECCVDFLQANDKIEGTPPESIPHRASISSAREPVTQKDDVDEFLDQPPPASVFRIMKYNKPEFWAILTGGLSTLIVGGSTPALAVIFGELYGVLSKTDREVVYQSTVYYSGMLLGLGLITGIATFLQLYLLNYSGVKLTSRMRKLAFAAILRQEAGWFDEEKNRTGVLCARLSTNAADIQGATGSRVGVVVQSVSTISIGIALGFFYSWKMTLIALIAAPLVFFGLYFEAKIIQGKSFLERKAIEGASKVSVEAISNIKTVASLGMEETFLERYDKELLIGEKGMKLKSKVRGAVYGIGTSAPYFSYALTLWYGGILVAEGEIEYKTVIKVSEALLFGVWVLGQSLAFAPNFSQAKISAARLFQLLDRTSKLKEGPLKDESWKTQGNVSFSSVEFSYPTRPEVQVLKGFTLDVEQGLSIALVGPSGCGKSTVIQILQRLYDPSSGVVSLDNIDISLLKFATLRRQFGIVSQEPMLFDRTIAENIVYGDNSRVVTEEEIISAAKSANIHNFIISLPQGYETKVGSGGKQLSGGQKQRIAIARALIRNPKILLLDEATSALDSESESVVQAALDNASSGRTTITVGHRLGAIKHADVIYHLDKGRIMQRRVQKERLGNKNTRQDIY